MAWRPPPNRVSTAVQPAATPGPNAEYMRTYRRRQAEGKLVVSLEVDPADIETLIEAKTLDPRRLPLCGPLRPMGASPNQPIHSERNLLSFCPPPPAVGRSRSY